MHNEVRKTGRMYQEFFGEEHRCGAEPRVRGGFAAALEAHKIAGWTGKIIQRQRAVIPVRRG